VASALNTRLYALAEGVSIAIESLRSNKVRAGLTILGIAVGVFVVVTMAAAVHGINASVARDFESTGPTTFFVTRYPISFEACDGTGETCKWLRNPPIRFHEIRGLRDLPGVFAAGARLDFGAPVKYKDRALSSTQVIGFTPDWTQIDKGIDLFPGRSFTYAENEGAAPVVLINKVMAERLFGEGDPIDKEIQISGTTFRVIGMFTREASFLSGGSNQAEAIVPIESARRHLNARTQQLGVAVVPRTNVSRDEAIDEVTAYLRGLRGLRPIEDSNFAIITQDKLFETYNKIFGMFFLVMIVLSAIGLIVGGVGVVAIMMISVTERTREIGVRKALGATKGTIMWQFLVEAVTLTGIGSAVGFVVGWLLAMVIRNATPIEASIPPLAILVAVAVSVVTGVLFGLFPAFRAAQLDPVAALRYE
jgi:putative ABC transport system permease protein